MAFKLTPNVIVERDAEERLRHLTHISEPYSGDEVTKGSARSLAAGYLLDVADIYQIPLDELKGLGLHPTEEIVEALETELRFGEEKKILETTSISFAQTHFGLPIWEAGFNVVVLDNPLRVTSSHSTLHYKLDIQKPNPDGPFAIDHLNAPLLAEALSFTQAIME